KDYLSRARADLGAVEFIHQRTNRGWTRDTGPLFVAQERISTGKGKTRRKTRKTAIVNFHFNAWAKYDDWQDDRKVADVAARLLVKRLFEAEVNGREFVLEGGGIEVNGRGTLLTTEECYLDPKVQVRNAGFGRREMEQGLKAYLGVKNVQWLVAG